MSDKAVFFMYDVLYMSYWNSVWQIIAPWVMSHGVKILGLLVFAFVIKLVAKKIITKTIERIIVARDGMTHDDEIKREQTLIRIVYGTVRAVVWVVVVLMILSELGINIGPLIAGAGIIGLAVGFGGQYLIRDVITGLFIVLENQYRVGDAVEIAGISGKVEDINLRITVLRDLDGIVHHIPHGEISTVSNRSKSFSRVNVNVGVSYSADLNKAKEVINTVGAVLANDEEWKHLIVKAPEFLRVDDLADSSVVLKIVGETMPGEQWSVAGELRKRIKESFDVNGIEIPFPQIVVHTKDE